VRKKREDKSGPRTEKRGEGWKQTNRKVYGYHVSVFERLKAERHKIKYIKHQFKKNDVPKGKILL